MDDEGLTPILTCLIVYYERQGYYYDNIQIPETPIEEVYTSFNSLLSYWFFICPGIPRIGKNGDEKKDRIPY